MAVQMASWPHVAPRCCVSALTCRVGVSVCVKYYMVYYMCKYINGCFHTCFHTCFHRDHRQPTTTPQAADADHRHRNPKPKPKPRTEGADSTEGADGGRRPSLPAP